MHKIPSPSDDEESMEQSGKKDNQPGFSVLKIFSRKKHKGNEDENNRGQAALEEVEKIFEALRPINTGA